MERSWATFNWRRTLDREAAARTVGLRWDAFTDDEVRVLFNMTDLLRDRELTHGPASPGEQTMMKAIEDEWEIRIRRMGDGR